MAVRECSFRCHGVIVSRLFFFPSSVAFSLRRDLSLLRGPFSHFRLIIGRYSSTLTFSCEPMNSSFFWEVNRIELDVRLCF